MTVLYPAPYGALTPLFAGTMPEALNYNGEVRPFRSIYRLSPFPLPLPPPSILRTFTGIRFSCLSLGLVQFMIPWARLGRCRPEVYDDEVGNKLWTWLEGEVRAFEAAQAGGR